MLHPAILSALATLSSLLNNVRRFLPIFVLLLIFLPVDASHAKVSSKITPVAQQSRNGQLSLGVFLGEDPGSGGLVQQTPLQIRVCDESNCEIYTAMSGNSWEGYSSHLWRWTNLDIDAKFKDRPITAQVPIDLLDGQNGWSQASNPVTISSTVSFDPMSFYRKQTTKPLLEIVYSAIDPTEMKRVDLCVNYREEFEVQIGDGPSPFISFGLNAAPYPSIRYDLYENGRLKKTHNFDTSWSPIMGAPSIPGCDTGTLGSFLLTAINGLKPGQTYTLVYTLSGPTSDDLVTSLDFVTPGGCPTGEVILAPSPRTFHYGILEQDGTLVSYQWGHMFGQDLPPRIAPIYHSGSKVIPFNGVLTDIRTSKEKWRFLRDIEEWALVLNDAAPQTPADTLAKTVFANCSSSKIRAQLSIDESTTPATEQGCTIINNQVVPLRPGVCKIDVAVAPRVKKSSVAQNRVISMNYVVTKLGKTKKLRNGATLTPRTASQKGSTISSTSLLSPSKGSKITRLSSRTKSVCTVKGKNVRMVKKGTCRYTATIVRKGKSASFSGSIKIL